MKSNTPKVQIEVWEAKERLYEMVKHLSPSAKIIPTLHNNIPILFLSA